MTLKYLEEEIEIPLYNELDASTVDNVDRIVIGFDLKEDRVNRILSDEEVDETIYLDVPTYVRG